MSEESLSRVLGLDKQSLTTTITTLIDQGIASRDEELGAVMCRRMVRDEALRRVRAECGKLGGNPALLGNTTRNKDKQNSTSGDKQNPNPFIFIFYFGKDSHRWKICPSRVDR